MTWSCIVVLKVLAYFQIFLKQDMDGLDGMIKGLDGVKLLKNNALKKWRLENNR